MATQYTVQRGDTLSKIGNKMGVPWQRIAEANNIRSPYIIQIGQVLTIPSTGTPPPPTVVVTPTVTTPPPVVVVDEKTKTVTPQPSVTVVTREGGTVVNATTLDKLLGFGTSVTALLTKQPYVPTAVQPVDGGFIETPAGGGYGGGGIVIDPRTGRPYAELPQNTGSAIQKFIEQNTGFLLLFGVGVVLYFLKPPKISKS